MADNGPVPQKLKRSFENETKPEYPQQTILPEDSTVTKMEKLERNESLKQEASEEPAAKRVKIEQSEGNQDGDEKPLVDSRDKVRGVAMVKHE